MSEKNLLPTLLETINSMVKKHNLEKYNFHSKITPENVYQEGITFHRNDFDDFIQLTMEEGSKLEGIENLEKLREHVKNGKSCLIAARHLSNFDVPNFYSLLRQNGKADLIDDIVFIAGRKLNEEDRSVLYVTSMFNRVVIIPKTEESKDSVKINLAAQRIIKSLKKEGKIIWLYPTGTREREWDENSKKAVPQTYNYLKSFDYVLLVNAEGVNYVISNEGLIGDIPVKTKIVLRFSKIYETKELIKELSLGCEDKSLIKQCVSDKLMEKIRSI